MNLVDSCGWIEYLTDGPSVDFFAPVLCQTKHLIVPVICLYEVYKATARECGKEAALEAISLMHQGIVRDIDESTSLHATQLSIEHHLPMADSLILAIARQNNATLWTQDAHFKDLPNVRFTQSGVERGGDAERVSFDSPS